MQLHLVGDFEEKLKIEEPEERAQAASYSSNEEVLIRLRLTNTPGASGMRGEPWAGVTSSTASAAHTTPQERMETRLGYLPQQSEFLPLAKEVTTKTNPETKHQIFHEWHNSIFQAVISGCGSLGLTERVDKITSGEFGRLLPEDVFYIRFFIRSTLDPTASNSPVIMVGVHTTVAEIFDWYVKKTYPEGAAAKVKMGLDLREINLGKRTMGIKYSYMQALIGGLMLKDTEWYRRYKECCVPPRFMRIWLVSCDRLPKGNYTQLT